MRSNGTFQDRFATVVAAAVIATGVGACGGSDDSDGGSDQEQARTAVERLYEGFAAGDPEMICEQLSEAAQEEIATGGLGGPSGSCVESYRKFLDDSEEAGGLNLTLKAKVESVKVTGDEAVAAVSYGGPGRTGEIPLKKIDGEWKLAAVGAGQPTQ